MVSFDVLVDGTFKIFQYETLARCLTDSNSNSESGHCSSSDRMTLMDFLKQIWQSVHLSSVAVITMTYDSNDTESALSNTSDKSRFNIWHNIFYNITTHTPTGVLCIIMVLQLYTVMCSQSQYIQLYVIHPKNLLTYLIN